MIARRPLACVAAVGAVLALSACEKPAPIVTVVSGGESRWTEASTWCFEDQTPPDCAERASGTTKIPVRAGETVGVDVDQELAEGGWYLELSAPDGGDQQQQQPQRSEPQEGHYFSFTAPSLAAGSTLQLDVRAVGEGEEPRGEFRFELVPAEQG